MPLTIEQQAGKQADVFVSADAFMPASGYPRAASGFLS
jgi:hypothetical protein